MRKVFVLLSFLLASNFVIAQKKSANKMTVCGLFFREFVKSEMINCYTNRYLKFSGHSNYSQAIDITKKDRLVITKIGDRQLNEYMDNTFFLNSLLLQNQMDSDTIIVYPEINDSSLYQKCNLVIDNLFKMNFIRDCALDLSPYYEHFDKEKLFKCFYFEGECFVKKIEEINHKYRPVLVDNYGLNNLSRYKTIIVISDIRLYTPYSIMNKCSIWLPEIRGTDL